jgi:hypothetical protein
MFFFIYLGSALYVGLLITLYLFGYLALSLKWSVCVYRRGGNTAMSFYNYRDFFIHPSPLATVVPFFQAPKTILEPRKEEVKGKCEGSGQTDPCYTHPFIF